MAEEREQDSGSGSDRRLVLGLGNPGAKYRDTRHNFGAWVVEELARRRRLELRPAECDSLFVRAPDLDLAVPQSYMNRSGHNARCLAERHGYRPERILVVYDDVSLPLGRIRLRTAGSPGGHRGMESVIESLRTEGIPRLRLGIAPDVEWQPGEELADFVLRPFDEEEKSKVEEEIVRAADACECWLAEGPTVAMNRFNR